ncbi:MAG TPA: hypothetical protein VEO01_29215 [Pseudonocardiaceae bacterium]|nr:hypothetical protein [Pseudonocardiaceae bacterium]
MIRKGDLSSDDWWDLCWLASDAARVPSRQWYRVFRAGLRYPDGTTVTNLDQPTHGERTRPRHRRRPGRCDRCSTPARGDPPGERPG